MPLSRFITGREGAGNQDKPENLPMHVLRLNFEEKSSRTITILSFQNFPEIIVVLENAGL